MISETKEVTTVVNAAARLCHGVSCMFCRIVGHQAYIKPTATSRTLSCRAKSLNPFQRLLALLETCSSASRS